METEGSSPSSSPPLPPSSPPPLDPDLSSQSLEDQGPQGPTAESAPVLLSDDLRDQIVRQVEYYFSDENLPTDKFLLKFVKRGKQGFVPIAVITSFRRMQKLVQDLSLVEAALRTSSNLVVSLDGKKVKRLHPLPAAAVDAADSRTVVVENLSEDYSAECIRRTFSNIGNITNISIHDPHSKEGINRKQAKTISSKLHARIEFETVKAAENAVATLNDEKNWRGMRVRHLLKRTEKQRLIPRKDKETFPGKDDIQVSDTAVDGQKLKSVDHHDEMVAE